MSLFGENSSISGTILCRENRFAGFTVGGVEELPSIEPPNDDLQASSPDLAHDATRQPESPFFSYARGQGNVYPQTPQSAGLWTALHWTLPAAFSRTTLEITAVSDLSGVWEAKPTPA